MGTAIGRMKRPQAVASTAIRPKKSWKSKKPAVGTATGTMRPWKSSAGTANGAKEIDWKPAVGTARPKDLLRLASLGQASIRKQLEHLDRATGVMR